MTLEGWAAEIVREKLFRFVGFTADPATRRLTDPAAVIAGLPPDTRPIPSVVAYDELLPRRRTTTPPTPDVKASTS